MSIDIEAAARRMIDPTITKNFVAADRAEDDASEVLAKACTAFAAATIWERRDPEILGALKDAYEAHKLAAFTATWAWKSYRADLKRCKDELAEEAQRAERTDMVS